MALGNISGIAYVVPDDPGHPDVLPEDTKGIAASIAARLREWGLRLNERVDNLAARSVRRNPHSRRRAAIDLAIPLVSSGNTSGWPGSSGTTYEIPEMLPSAISDLLVRGGAAAA